MDYSKRIIERLISLEYEFKEDFKPDEIYNFKINFCGDKIDFYLKLNENYEIIKIRYKSHSCSLNVISAEIICEYIEKNKINKNKLKEINFKEIIQKELGEIPKEKLHCINFNFN